MNVRGLKRLFAQVPREVDKAIEEAMPDIIKDIQANFAQEKNPYGVPWTPSQSSGPLFGGTSGSIYSSFDSTYRGGTHILMNTDPVSPYHHYGTEHLPERKLLPDEGLTKAQMAILQEAVNKRLEKL